MLSTWSPFHQSTHPPVRCAHPPIHPCDVPILVRRHNLPAAFSLPGDELQWIVECIATLTVAPPEAADLAGGIAKRVLRLFKAQVEDWYDVCRQLSDWEDHFLLDQPAPERLAEHARLLDELERVGHWMSLTTQSPDFPDRSTAELVAMTLRDLQDAHALWHGNLSRERRQEILRAVFNEP